jgi:NAD(P)H-hydrate epimerase
MAEPRTITREQAREIDRKAIESGVPALLLMENAARACADEAERVLRIDGVARAMARLRMPGSKDDIPRNVDELERWKDKLHRAEAPVVILCGPGNNGGDGLAIARTLHNRGHEVRVYYVGKPAALAKAAPEVRAHHEMLLALGVEVHALETTAQRKDALPVLKDAPLIVDALFGTGLSRTIEDPFRAVIEAANDVDTPKLAVDIPSGLDANTGDVLGVCIRAESTVTFIAEKPGFHRGAGPTFCGQVLVAEIGIPRNLL